MEQKYIMEMKNIVKAFPVEGAEPFLALKGVDANIPRGGFTVLKGRSGSGKTTLINIMGALDKPTEGSVFFDGKELTALSEHEREQIRRTKMGFVFQSVSLIPMLNAYEKLSGGEQQRVAIARAIVHKPHILFADEPTAELDSHTSKIVAGLFRQLVEKEGITVLMTTHDSSLMNVGSHLIELADGEVVG